MEPALYKPNIVVITDAHLTVELFLKGPSAYTVSIVDPANDAEAIACAGRSALIVIDQTSALHLEAPWFRYLQRSNTRLPVVLLTNGTRDLTASGFNGVDVRHLEPHEVTNGLWPAITEALSKRPHSGRRTGEPRLPAFLCTGVNARQIEPLVTAIAQADIPVLIQGETGVGKEVLARHIHAISARGNGPFLKLNCAALPPELVESELFGYERGAFTGAFRSTPGKFELAEGGVLLLDEIGDMDVRLQAKLLQVLQDHEFHRLGAARTSRVNVRVIAATHCDLETALHEKRFREDLYYRLNVASVLIPPLRDRLDELIPLAEYFLKRHASTTNITSPELTPAIQDALCAYEWPGNVRELENLMRKYIVMPDPVLLLEDLQHRSARRLRVMAASARLSVEASSRAEATSRAEASGVANNQSKAPDETGWEGPAEDGSGSRTMAQVDAYKRETEADAIRAALEKTNWHRKQAAALLQVDYKVFLYRMKRLGIGVKDTGQQLTRARAASSELRQFG